MTWNNVFDWISEKYPIGIILIIVSFVIWKIAQFYYTRFKITENKVKLNEDKIKDTEKIITDTEKIVKETENKVKELPCKKHDTMFNSVIEDIGIIRTFILSKNPTAISIFSAKKSPRKLNDEGIKLFETISGKKFLVDNEQFFIAGIEKRKPKTALDVEQNANEVLVENLGNDMFNDIKKWVYNTPSIEVKIGEEVKDYSITMNDICFILSIPLRDKYLELHPELV